VRHNLVKELSIHKWSFLQQAALIGAIVLAIMISGLLYIYYRQVQDKPLSLFFQELEAQQVILKEKIPELQIQKIAAYQRGRNPFSYAERLMKQGQHLLIEHGLKAFPTDVLKLVGIISLGDKFWAIIETPDGQVHQATIGTSVGQSYGHISNITNQQIDILEKRSAEEGGWAEYTTTLKLEALRQQE